MQQGQNIDESGLSVNVCYGFTSVRPEMGVGILVLEPTSAPVDVLDLADLKQEVLQELAEEAADMVVDEILDSCQDEAGGDWMFDGQLGAEAHQ